MSICTTAMTDEFVHDAWYAAASSNEVDRKLLQRTVLGKRLVLYRTEAGSPVALRDRCAHRFAPLSLGTLKGDCVSCPYHGMTYDPSGQCVHVPGQQSVPPLAVVRSFPVIEQYGLVFVWMGDPALADPGLLVQIEQYGRPDWGLSRGYSLFGASWRNITDNLVDPAHTTFVHTQTIGNESGGEVPVSASERDGVVSCGRWVENAPAVPIVAHYANPIGPMDRWQFYHVQAPCTSWVDFGAFAAGLEHNAQEQAHAPYRVLSYAFLTPQTRNTTHYFSFQLRNFAAQDAAVTSEFERLYKDTFEEDRLLLEAIQREEDEVPGLKPVRIASDAGVARLRRLVDDMLSRNYRATPCFVTSDGPPSSEQPGPATTKPGPETTLMNRVETDRSPALHADRTDA